MLKQWCVFFIALIGFSQASFSQDAIWVTPLDQKTTIYEVHESDEALKKDFPNLKSIKNFVPHYKKSLRLLKRGVVEGATYKLWMDIQDREQTTLELVRYIEEHLKEALRITQNQLHFTMNRYDILLSSRRDEKSRAEYVRGYNIIVLETPDWYITKNNLLPGQVLAFNTLVHELTHMENHLYRHEPESYFRELVASVSGVYGSIVAEAYQWENTLQQSLRGAKSMDFEFWCKRPDQRDKPRCFGSFIGIYLGWMLHGNTYKVMHPDYGKLRLFVEHYIKIKHAFGIEAFNESLKAAGIDRDLEGMMIDYDYFSKKYLLGLPQF